MHLAAHLAALIAVLGTGVIYGTDAFCATRLGPHYRAPRRFSIHEGC